MGNDHGILCRKKRKSPPNPEEKNEERQPAGKDKRRSSSGRLKDFISRVKAVCGKEETNFNPVFLENVYDHLEYRENVGMMMEALQELMDPQTGGGEQKTDNSQPVNVYMEIIDTLNTMKQDHFNDGSVHDKLNKQMADSIERSLEAMNLLTSDGWKSGMNALGPMDRFVKDTHNFQHNFEDMKESKAKMGIFREAVKKASTAEEVNTAGKEYAAEVTKFNRHGEVAEAELDNHLEDAYRHQAALLDFCRMRAIYHGKMADELRILDNQLQPLLQVLEKDEPGKKKENNKEFSSKAQ